MIFSNLHFLEQVYIVTSIITAVGSGALGCFVYFKNTRKSVNKSYFFMSMSVFLWSFALFFCHTTPNYDQAFFWNKILHLGSIFIPLTFFHFILNLLGSVHQYRKVLILGSAFAIILSLSIPFNLLLSGMAPKFVFHLWPIPGVMYPFFLVYFSSYAFFALFLVFQQYRRSTGNWREQLKCIFLGVSIAFIGGSTNYAYVYDIPIPPVGNFFVFFYDIFLAYSIVKFRFMDIKLAFTRAGTFVTVYTIVLGIPIWVGFETMGGGPWLFPVVLMAILATGGPFLYLAVQRKAEARILAEQRKYQDTLRQASAGMGRIRDLKRLLNLIVSILTRVVRIEHVFIYLLDRGSSVYRLSASRRISVKDPVRNELFQEHAIVKYFRNTDIPLVREEVRQRIERDKEYGLRIIGDELNELGAELVFPVFIRLELAAIVVMGKKANHRRYSEDDLAVFSILANQASLAIENAQSYEEMKKTQEQLFKADKMATIGTMADGLSHQINNRLHALGFIASDMLDTLKLKKSLFEAPELKAIADEFEYSLSRLQENVHHGGEIVRGLMKYTRKGEEGFSPCNIDDIIRTAYEMAQFKIRSADFKIIKEYDPKFISKVKGNFTQLQEVFFNLIDNAYDATVQRKVEFKEEGYSGSIRVGAKEVDGFLEIIFSDNGIGVKSTDQDKLFTPFFTTKATSKKGTGLGLYVIRKIIEDNHGGKVEMRSVYGQGTDIFLRLSLSKE